MPGTLAEVALKNAGDAAIFVSHKYSDANTDAPTRAFARPRCICPAVSVPLVGSGSATPQSQPAWCPARRRAQAQAVTDSESIPRHVVVSGTIA
jgi:hypothetical protein